MIVGDGALLDPSRGTEELFHADMVVAVVRNDHEALAFVPTYEVRPRDANSGELLAEELVRSVQHEYDLVAAEMTARGYRVVRIPFEDHPVRAPVNVSKFVDRTTGKPFVLLGRYPDHRPSAPDATTPMSRLGEAVRRLQDLVDDSGADAGRIALGGAPGRHRRRVEAGRRGLRGPERRIRTAARSLREEWHRRGSDRAVPDGSGRDPLPPAALNQKIFRTFSERTTPPKPRLRPDTGVPASRRTSVAQGPANSPEIPAPLK